MTVCDNGVLWLKGRDDRKTRLRSSEPGTRWKIVAGTNLTGKVYCLDVRDSDASGGETIKARRSVGRTANNLNWDFPGGFTLIVR